jgi:hypothetical protein
MTPGDHRRSRLRQLTDVRHLARRASEAARGGVEAFSKGGPAGLQSWIKDAWYWRFDPRVRRWAAELPNQQRLDREFDQRYGVDTAGQVDLSQVGVAPADLARGGGLYRPVWTAVFHTAVRSIPAAPDSLTFLDYGSGKGKALLLASDYPFRRILGVEFARPLHDIAVKNLGLYRSQSQRCHQLESLCGDAMEFKPPDEPLAAFFFNPFDDATMEVVLDNLRASVARAPRPVFIVYCNTRHVREHEKVFASKPFLTEEARGDQFLVYRVRSG